MISEFPLRNRVKELRERIGLRQADLADAVGITRQTIIAIEKGRLNPSILISLKVSRMLREPVDYVFYLAPGIEALSVSEEQFEETNAAPRKGKKGRPKGSRKTKVVERIEDPEADAVEVSEEPEELADVTQIESLEVLPDVEILSPEVTAPVADEAPVMYEEEESSAYEAAQVAVAEVDDIRYELDRDSDASIEESQEEVEPDSSEVVEEPSAEVAFGAPAPEPEEQDRQSEVRETKSGQAIWDFF